MMELLFMGLHLMVTRSVGTFMVRRLPVVILLLAEYLQNRLKTSLVLILGVCLKR